ncbi:hypothetical protein BGZ70_002967 [Mortierella alpina]|uniref:Phosphatidylglycerol/phosphatidylinositol transfer protein n=1 Tax=Mortierella alpina TaxID=64518 RepID=A0A9P6LWS3_MORAP|nr:hypothetical protein BGZ70_002967 [Mortierella alpina]
MKFITAIAALFVATVANAQVNFTNCVDTPPDIVLSTFSISPDPICIGKEICATVTGVLSLPVIAGAKFSVVGRWLGRIVYQDHHDLCTLMAAQGHPCPVLTTVTSITVCVPVKAHMPNNIPFQLTVKALNGNNHLLYCQAATVLATKTC